MDRKSRGRAKGRGAKKTKNTDTSHTTVAQSAVGKKENHTVTAHRTESNDNQLAEYLLSTHDSGFYGIGNKTTSVTTSSNKRPLSTSPIPPNKQFVRLLNNDGELEGHAVPFSGYTQSSTNNRHVGGSSIPVIVKSDDRLTPDMSTSRVSPDPHKRLSPLISFPPHLERQSPHFNRSDMKTSPLRLSPYFEQRDSPDLFRAEIQSFNKNVALSLSPAGGSKTNTPSPAKDRPSISPFKAHLLQAVPESERYSPNKYANYTPNRNEIKTISPVHSLQSPSQPKDAGVTKPHEQKTLVRMLKNGSNLVPVTIVTTAASVVRNNIVHDVTNNVVQNNLQNNVHNSLQSNVVQNLLQNSVNIQNSVPIHSVHNTQSNFVPNNVMIAQSNAVRNAISAFKNSNVTRDKPTSLLREHLTSTLDKTDILHRGITNIFSDVSDIQKLNPVSKSTVPVSQLINTNNAHTLSAEITQNLLKNKETAARLNVPNDVKPPFTISSFNLSHHPLNVTIPQAQYTLPSIPHAILQQGTIPAIIPYIGYNLPTVSLDSLNKPLVTETSRTKPEPPANPFFQNLRIIEEAASSLNKQQHTDSKPPTKRKKASLTTHKLPIYSQPAKATVKKEVEYATMPCPCSRRKEVLSKFSTTNSSFRSKTQSVTLHRMRYGCTTSAAKSLDILRRNLQKSINEEISNVVNTNIEKFFKPAIDNIKFNNGANAIGDEHIQVISRQILEEAKKMYESCVPSRSTTPVRDNSDAVSESGSYTGSKRLHNGVSRVKAVRPSDSDSELSVPVKRKKGRPAFNISGRSTPSKTFKAADNVKREGPKWDPDRLTTSMEFVTGARANKALGLGATRGRLYVKHPELFKYCGDQEDKQWLHDNYYMSAAGGKAYLMVVEDIRGLSHTEEYRTTPLQMSAIVAFTVPQFMVDKMRIQMAAQRTATSEKKVEIPPADTAEPETIIPGLPFSHFMEDDEPKVTKDISLSPANTEDMDLLSTGGDHLSPADDHMSTGGDTTDMSPFTMTGGFDDVTSPVHSDYDTLPDDHPLSARFDLSK